MPFILVHGDAKTNKVYVLYPYTWDNHRNHVGIRYVAEFLQVSGRVARCFSELNPNLWCEHSASWSVSCFTREAAFWHCTWEGRRGWSKYLGPPSVLWEQDGAPSSWLGPGPALATVATWVTKHMSNPSAFQINLFIKFMENITQSLLWYIILKSSLFITGMF